MPRPHVAKDEHIPLTQNTFRGIFARGITDSVPDAFFSDARNIQFNESEASTRFGSELNITKTNLVRAFDYKRIGENPRQILLDNAGHLYDSTNLATPIWTDASVVDFSMVNYNNRAYITVHNRVKGLAGKFLLVYEGSGTARLAAGTAPSGFTLVAANSGLSGNVEAGVHIVAVAGITSSGFITAPGPAIFATYVAVGDFKLAVSAIPVLGSQYVARVILVSKAVPVSLFNGNQYGYELFFAPGGTIGDNVTTTATLNFFDADLVQSADYLIDNESQIPAGVGIGVYSNRLCVWGEDANQFTMRLSEPGQPEVFSALDGFITVDPSDSESGLKNAFEFRKNLVLQTSNRFYLTSDNGSAPSTWDCPAIDKSSGTECFGVANVLDARGTNTDRVFVATRSGLISFEGYVKRPELTWNVEGIWQRINKVYFNLVQVVDDPENHRLFITVPLDSNTAISHILYGDYSKAFTVYGTLDEKAIKWALWSFPTAPVSIMGAIDINTRVPILHLVLAGGNTYNVREGLTSDFGNAIDHWITFALKTAIYGMINHFGGYHFRIIGTGTPVITAIGLDAVQTATLPTFTLSQTPGGEVTKPINFVNEKMALKFRLSNFGENFTIASLVIMARGLWMRRPN